MNYVYIAASIDGYIATTDGDVDWLPKKKVFVVSSSLTEIPILPGGGIPFFGELSAPLRSAQIDTKLHNDALVMSRYARKI